MGPKTSAFDAYIAKSADFAQPILEHLRERRRAIVMLALLLSACGGRDDAMPPKAVDSVGGKFATVEFGELRFLEGTWRGRMADGKSFYERYTFVDDTTIVMHNLSDSTLARATDSSRITLRDGTIASESGSSRYVASKIDSTGIQFEPVTGAANRFRWVSIGPNAWRATLESKNKDGTATTTVYPMERIAP